MASAGHLRSTLRVLHLLALRRQFLFGLFSLFRARAVKIIHRKRKNIKKQHKHNNCPHRTLQKFRKILLWLFHIKKAECQENSNMFIRFTTTMFHRLLHKPAKKIVTELTTTLNGKPFSYKLTQSSNARTVRLKIGMRTGLEIIVPYRFQVSHVPAIFKDHAEWIQKQLQKQETRKKLQVEQELQDGSVLSVLGDVYKVKIIPALTPSSSATRKGSTPATFSTRKKPHVKRVQQLIFVEDRAIVDGYELHIFCDGSIKQAKATLEKYLRTVAEKYFLKRTTDLAQEMGLTFRHLTVRGQKTRWGSCTREKNLNFNWRLIMLPLPVAESVIIHELAHTTHMNHSKSFYTLVERFCPEYRQLQKHLHHPQFLL